MSETLGANVDSTIIIGGFLAFLFITVQVSNPKQNVELSFLQQVIKYFKQSSSILFVLLIVSFLIAIFVGYHKKIYEITPPQEFTTLKNHVLRVSCSFVKLERN